MYTVGTLFCLQLPNIDTTCSEDKMKVEKVIKRETLIAVYVVNNGEVKYT